MRLFLKIRSTADEKKFILESVEFAQSSLAPAMPHGWSDGLAAFIQLCFTTRIAFLDDPSAEAPPLSGGVGTPAAALYRVYDEGRTVVWPSTIFQSHRAFQGCIRRKSKDKKTFFLVWIKPEKIPPQAIVISLNGDDISDSREKMCDIAAVWFELPQLAKRRRLRLGILRSGDLAFTREIAIGLKDRLASLNYELEPGLVDFPGPTIAPIEESSNGSQSLVPPWRTAIDQLYQRGAQGFDYLLTVGTQASLALKLYDPENFARPGFFPPVLFLGVTYPVGNRLIDSLFSRYEPRDIGGVAYGADGLRSIAAIIHNWLLPGCSMKFVFFKDHPQDQEAAKQLRRTRLYYERQLLIEEVTPDTFPSAVQDAECVYLSWYTFEAMFESVDPTMFQLSRLLRDRRVVATTRANCRDGLTFAAVGADDAAIGHAGAELIHKRVNGKISSFGHSDIIIPTVQYWINDQVAEAKGIKFAPDVRARAANSPNAGLE